jgi:ribosomal 50S subunit-associated protein YjgA (DUF615 family)
MSRLKRITEVSVVDAWDTVRIACQNLNIEIRKGQEPDASALASIAQHLRSPVVAVHMLFQLMNREETSPVPIAKLIQSIVMRFSTPRTPIHVTDFDFLFGTEFSAVGDVLPGDVAYSVLSAIANASDDVSSWRQALLLGRNARERAVLPVESKLDQLRKEISRKGIWANGNILECAVMLRRVRALIAHDDRMPEHDVPIEDIQLCLEIGRGNTGLRNCGLRAHAYVVAHLQLLDHCESQLQTLCASFPNLQVSHLRFLVKHNFDLEDSRFASIAKSVLDSMAAKCAYLPLRSVVDVGCAKLKEIVQADPSLSGFLVGLPLVKLEPTSSTPPRGIMSEATTRSVDLPPLSVSNSSLSLSSSASFHSCSSSSPAVALHSTLPEDAEAKQREYEELMVLAQRKRGVKRTLAQIADSDATLSTQPLSQYGQLPPWQLIQPELPLDGKQPAMKKGDRPFSDVWQQVCCDPSREGIDTDFYALGQELGRKGDAWFLHEIIRGWFSTAHK